MTCCPAWRSRHKERPRCLRLACWNEHRKYLLPTSDHVALPFFRARGHNDILSLTFRIPYLENVTFQDRICCQKHVMTRVNSFPRIGQSLASRVEQAFMVKLDRSSEAVVEGVRALGNNNVTLLGLHPCLRLAFLASDITRASNMRVPSQSRRTISSLSTRLISSVVSHVSPNTLLILHPCPMPTSPPAPVNMVLGRLQPSPSIMNNA